MDSSYSTYNNCPWVSFQSVFETSHQEAIVHRFSHEQLTFQPSIREHAEPNVNSDQKPSDTQNTFIQISQDIRNPIATAHPRKKYLKKNTESNICNQAFSFLVSRKKSHELLSRILEFGGHIWQESGRLYYAYARVLKLNRPKYLNKKGLITMTTNPTNYLLQEIAGSAVYSDKLVIAEFSRLLRIMLRYFLDSLCPSTVLTSRKLSKQTYAEHFQRRRQISELLSKVTQAASRGVFE